MRAVPHLCEFYPDICLITEEKARKNLNQGSRRMPVGKEGHYLKVKHCDFPRRPGVHWHEQKRNDTQRNNRNIKRAIIYDLVWFDAGWESGGGGGGVGGG